MDLSWFTDFVSKLWKYLKDIFWWLIDSFFTPFRWVLDGLFSVATALFLLAFDGFLSAVVAVFKGIDFSAVLFSSIGSASGLPDLAVWFITQLGLPQCVTMVVAAIGIRMLLNLIPAAVTRI
jgi:hypothetical protein